MTKAGFCSQDANVHQQAASEAGARKGFWNSHTLALTTASKAPN